MPVTTAGKTYLLSVDYGRSVKNGMRAGRYDWANPDINSRNFPTNKRKGMVGVAVELIHLHLNRVISTEEALHELDRMGYHPVELHELLAFGEKYPEVQIEFPVVALGSVWRDRYGNRVAPCLLGLGSERGLDLLWTEYGWDKFFRFAAVRK